MTEIIKDESLGKSGGPTINSLRRTFDQVFNQIYVRGYNKCNGVHHLHYLSHFVGDVSKSTRLWLSWIIQITDEKLLINITYAEFEGQQKIFGIQDQRVAEEVKFIIKPLNLHAPSGMTYLVSEQNFVILNSLIMLSTFPKHFDSHLRSLIDALKRQASAKFVVFLPYLMHFSQCLQEYTNFQKYSKDAYLTVNEQTLVKKLQFMKSNIRLAQKSRKGVAENLQRISGIDLEMIQKCSQLISESVFGFRAAMNLFSNEIHKLQHTQSPILEDLRSCRQTIMSGIKIITTVEKQKIQEKSGGTGVIQFLKFQYEIYDSIHNCGFSAVTHKKNSISGKETLTSDSEDKLDTKNSYWNVLATKRPLGDTQNAIHCFQNQHLVLEYLRGEKCGFLAKYFKEVDRTDGPLYMPVYQQDLRSLIDSQNTMTLGNKLRLALKIVQGVKFLGSRFICHRDLKPTNIMVEAQENGFNPRIIDMGSSCAFYGKDMVKVEDDRLLSTEKYYYPYKQCNPSIQRLYSMKQYEQHPFFDSFSIGRILQLLFFENSRMKLDHIKQKLVKENLWYIIKQCQEQNPLDRLSPSEIGKMLAAMVLIQENNCPPQDILS